MLLIEDNIFLSPNKPIEKILYWGNPFCSPHYPNKSPFPQTCFHPLNLKTRAVFIYFIHILPFQGYNFLYMMLLQSFFMSYFTQPTQYTKTEAVLFRTYTFHKISLLEGHANNSTLETMSSQIPLNLFKFFSHIFHSPMGI